MKTAVVIPNLNGEEFLKEAIDSIMGQSYPATLIVVDNASEDKSIDILKEYGDEIVLLNNPKNLGFTGGVNPGIKYSIENNYDAVALFNNDALADKEWLGQLISELKDNRGIITGKLLSIDKTFIDSTGECMSEWGLAFPRGRNRSTTSNHFTNPGAVFGATGGASLYSVPMLKQIGLFDQNYFAYYEDVDISFRAQLVGWKVWYTPKAIAYHRISQTSKRMYKGFSIYHSFKNMPLLLYKNMPYALRRDIFPRFWFAYWLFFANAIRRGYAKDAWNGYWSFRKIKNNLPEIKQSVSDQYIASLLTDGPPPQSHILNSLYNKFHGKK